MENMDDQALVAAATTLILASGAYYLQKKKKKPQKRRFWMVSLNRARERYNEGMLAALRREPPGKFENFFRMSASDFEVLLSMIGPSISKKDTHWRKCIPAQERLAITLRFLTSGDGFRSLGLLFKVSHQAISSIVHEVVDALNESLRKVIELPRSENEWKSVTQGFKEQWNFPHCLGVLDGKHVVLQAPANSETKQFTYKKTCSIVLLAAVDADYRFLFVDIGAQGGMEDSGVFDTTELNRRLQTGEKMPNSEPLPGRNVSVPYVLIADDAFALSKYLLKPFPGNHERVCLEGVFNYWLCRTQRIVENTFGILSRVFRVFRTPMRLEPSRAVAVTYACTLLHNFLRTSETSRNIYSPPGTFDTEQEGVLVPGSWRQGGIQNTAFVNFKRRARSNSQVAKAIREEFANYFKTNGAIPWQDNYN